MFPAHEAVGVDGDAADVGNAAGYPFALVVTPFPQACAVQGDGYECVDAVEPVVGAEFPGIELTQIAGTRFPVVVFDLVQQVAVGGVG